MSITRKEYLKYIEIEKTKNDEIDLENIKHVIEKIDIDKFMTSNLLKVGKKNIVAKIRYFNNIYDIMSFLIEHPKVYFNMIGKTETEYYLKFGD